jgi:hypothetical protein
MVGPGEEEAEEGRYRMVFKEITGPTRGEVAAGGSRGRRVSQGGSEVWWRWREKDFNLWELEMLIWKWCQREEKEGGGGREEGKGTPMDRFSFQTISFSKRYFDLNCK